MTTGSHSDNIGKSIDGVDHKKRSVKGKIIGVDPSPARLAAGPYYVVRPIDPLHDRVNRNALVFVRCEAESQIG